MPKIFNYFEIKKKIFFIYGRVNLSKKYLYSRNLFLWFNFLRKYFFKLLNLYFTKRNPQKLFLI
jgi:hypothetical protein